MASHAGIVTAAQTKGFQEKTFWPSSIPNGRRLKAASQKFTMKPIDPTNPKNPPKLAKTRNPSPTKMFARGPDREISPFSRFVIPYPKPKDLGTMYTAPGAANIIRPPETKAKITAMARPRGQSRNSAWQPYDRDTYLCASSCPTKPNPSVINETANIMGKVAGANNALAEKQKPSTSQAINSC